MFARPITLFSRLALLSAVATLAACATQQENPHYQHSTQYKGDSPVTATASNTSYASTSSANSSYVGTTVSGDSAYQQANHQQADGSYFVQSSHPVYANNAELRQNRHFTAAPQTNQAQPALIQAAHTQPAYSQSTTYGQSSTPSYSQVSAECISSGAQGQAHCLPTSMPLTSQTASVATPYYGEPQTLYVTSETTTASSPTDSTMPESYGTPGYEAMKNAESSWTQQGVATPEWEPAQAAPQHAAVPHQAVPITQPFASPLPAPTTRGALVQPVRSQPIIAAPQYSQALGTQYEVQEGDTVYSFSRKLCSSVEDIRSMNGLDAGYGIQLGQTLRLPASKC